MNSVRFTLPVLSADEVPVLKAHGADELYCGYQDEAWRRKFGGDAVISRRQGAANLETPEALYRLSAEAKRHGLPVDLALNARVTGETLPDLKRIARFWAEIGGSGIILQDPGLLSALRELKNLRFTVSLLAVTVNRHGAAFWRSLGADRIVLPRFLRPEEMGAIAKAEPGPEYEAMVMGDLCPFMDGFCRSVHARGGIPAGEGELPVRAEKTWNTSGRAHHLCLEYQSPVPDPCAACRLEELSARGVAVGKVGGRGLPLETRLRWLDFLVRARSGAGEEHIRERYPEVFGHGCRCYYPPAGQAGFDFVKAGGADGTRGPEGAKDREEADGGENAPGTDKGGFFTRAAPGTALPGASLPLRAFGHSSCPRALSQALSGLARTDIAEPVSVTVPPVTPAMEESLETLLAAARDFRFVRFIVNDWGTLRRVAEWKRERRFPAELIVGVLLAGQDSDPVIRSFPEPQPDRKVTVGGETLLLQWTPPPETLRRHWAEPSALHLWEFLRAMGADGIELGLQALEIPAGGDVPFLLRREGVLSVRPCRGECGKCEICEKFGGKEVPRSGAVLRFDRNLLTWEDAGPETERTAHSDDALLSANDQYLSN